MDATVNPQGLSILVVDDEPLALSQMTWLLGSEPQAGEVFTAPDARSAEQVLQRRRIDVVLLDIHMPGMSGLALARRLRDLPAAEPQDESGPQVIFVTADAHPAVEAFELEARDYLLKPVRAERLAEALRRASAARDAATQDRPEAVRVSVLQGDSTVLVNLHDIRWVQAHGDYARLHTQAGTYLLRSPLAELAEAWQEHGFIRTHRSSLVNVLHVQRVTRRQGRMLIEVPGAELEVSRRLMPQVRERLELGR
ncbi:LytR/AlgR family response regulator transcription factor [Nesterenkonia sandarakina]|uniref:LytTR family two component transcriptional regulator n=1 Tax=Nesterenkonia sandarakina TaxID=272918 RepID=A0A2T0YKM2_9MICC|nr:LytTR family DNA-binding domain-containing protein [Nesterenkonia sandarakina]PRZ15673.1 LytTR family two component transcriptional regulator [Nesterenkonia sandarakina]